MQLITDSRDQLELFSSYEFDAFHLELRDWYGSPLEDGAFQQWRAGRPIVDPAFDEWLDRVRGLTSAGRTIRRVRVVTEPVTEYVRFEWEETAKNVDAGESIRRLPRHRLPRDLNLPAGGKDWWVFDDRLVALGHLDDAGGSLGWELTRDAATVRECVEARDRLWIVATLHRDYRPRFA